MSVPRSFINYMKIMREYYKSGATRQDPVPQDFNFDDIEVDASSYGFIGNDNFDRNINDIGNNKIKKNQQPIPSSVKPSIVKPSNVKLLSKNTIAKTEITTIDLFGQNDRLNKLSQQPLTPSKTTSVLAKKFKTAFSTMVTNFSQKSK
ncbi:hypothetical protein [Cognaticolwellia aestuarii]|uniref:hypothetical protein n=1 Tax=Cognaticolwellia aestuarii TaxID=329993 RepID=UPI0011783962|nr:hypothetical protein [Cognaticolwellia aestuarii]